MGLITATNSIVNLTGTLQSAGFASLNIGPNSLLLLPAGFSPTIFGSYTNAGLTHTVGTPLIVGSSQGFAGIGSIGDFVSCGGTISAAPGGWINLNGGVMVSGSGGVNLGSGSFQANNSASGISAGSLTAQNGYVAWSLGGTFTQSGGTATLGDFTGLSGGLYVGYNAGASGTYNLSGSGTLAALNAYVGYNGSGAVVQSGGTSNIGSATSGVGALYIGCNPGSSGSYTLTNAGALSAISEYVGSSGTGAFIQSGGSNTVSTGNLWIGYNLNSSGSYTLTGSGALSANMLTVGSSGSGTFIQSGGTINSPNASSTIISIGDSAGSNGAYVLNGAGQVFSNTEWVGSYGTGAFTHSSGTNSFGTGGLLLSYNGGPGTYTLNGSGVVLAGGEESVGYSGSGAFIQSGGTNMSASSGAFSLILWDIAGCSGSYSLSGAGLLSPDALYVGNFGSGLFTQTGGTNSVGTNGADILPLYVGNNAGSSGSYVLGGTGALSSPNGEYVGYSGSGAFVQTGGTNTVSGGTNTVSSGLYLAYTSTGNGSYTLSGSGVLVSLANEYVALAAWGPLSNPAE